MTIAALRRRAARALVSIAWFASLPACRRVSEEPVRPAATPAPPATALATSEDSGLLPPLETKCVSDADCAHAWTYEIEGKCCSGTCSPKPTTKAWVEKVDAICTKAGHSEACPTKKCAAPRIVVCVSGQCTFGAGVDPKW